MNLSCVTLKNGTKNALVKSEAHTEIYASQARALDECIQKCFCLNASKVPSTILGLTILEMNEQSQDVPGCIKLN